MDELADFIKGYGWQECPEERWDPVQKHNLGDFYEVSNRGNLRCAHWEKEIMAKSPLLEIDKGDYICILYNNIENGDIETGYLHNLVALTFIFNNNPDRKKYVCHKNGNLLDNHVENLVWVSRKKFFDKTTTGVKSYFRS